MNPNPGGDLEIFAKKITGKATLEELTERVCEAHKAAQGAAANALAEVAIARQMFEEILRLITELRPQPPPAPA